MSLHDMEHQPEKAERNLDDIPENDDDLDTGKVDPGEYAKTLAKQVVTHLGLGLAVLVYVVGGALLFQEIELDDEKANKQAGVDRSWEIETFRAQVADSMWNHKWSVDYNKTVAALLTEYHANITQAIADHGYGGTGITDNDISYGWSFPSALLFTVTVVTTIGYGHIAPASELGQIVCIGYALIGIPLMLMFLANIGDAMAKTFRVTYGRGCCFCCNRRRLKEYTTGQEEYIAQKRRGGGRANPDDPDRIGSAGSRSAWDDPNDKTKKPGSAGSRTGSGNVKKRKKNKVGDAKDGKSPRDNDGKSPRDNDGKSPRDPNDPNQRPLEDDEEFVMVTAEDLEPKDDEINVPISLTLVVIASYVMVGAVLFMAYNEWSWITGAYFSFVTLSTIGFGDLTPGWSSVGTVSGNIKLAITSFYIIMGLAVLSMSFNLMMEEMIEKFTWLGKKIGIIDDDEEEVAEDAAKAAATTEQRQSVTADTADLIKHQ